MLHNARQVEARGFLRPGVNAERAAEVFWAVTGSGVYESLVMKRGWSGDEFASFVGEALAGALVAAQRPARCTRPWARRWLPWDAGPADGCA
jgi:hypothetical protein